MSFCTPRVLQNMHEDARNHPLVLMFNRAGMWAVPYEVHARNLPQPKNGTLTIVVSVWRGETLATREFAELAET